MKNTLCGRKVSDIGIGTYGMGGNQNPDYSEDARHIDALRYALDHGINVIDTAEMYAGGHTEEVVGKAIANYSRSELFIISKVWSNHMKHDDVLESARKSAARMGTDYIDLYLIHWPNPKVPISETVSAMEELVSSGIVRNIGVSNFSVNQLKEAMEATDSSKICANQVEYNYGTRSVESDLIPFCEKNNVDVIAYTPIMKGRTSGYPKLLAISEKYGVSAVQMSLRYIMEKAYAIPKSSKPEHIDELLESGKIALSPEDYKGLTD